MTRGETAAGQEELPGIAAPIVLCGDHLAGKIHDRDVARTVAGIRRVYFTNASVQTRSIKREFVWGIIVRYRGARPGEAL